LTLLDCCGEVDIVVFSLPGCAACVKLKQMIANVMSDAHDTRFARMLRFHEIVSGEQHEFFPAREVQPRMFPTLIAYCNDSPILGWEGFALMAASEIQEAHVREVLEQSVDYLN
jgi:hypothetical protein